MESAAASTSLRDQLEHWIDIIRRRDDLTCFGKSKGGERCHNTLSQDTYIKLALLFKKSVAIFKSSHDGLEKLLEEASSLVMCIRRHQNQSPAKLKEWLGMISNSDSDCGVPMSSNATCERTPVLDQDILSSEKNHTRLTDTGDIPGVIEEPDFQRPKSPLEPDANDSGIESSEDEEASTAPIVDSEKAKAVPQTPQKFSQPASTDSGISMSYDAHAESYMGTIEDRETPESPLAKKLKARQATTKTQPSRPAATPIQPMPLSIRPKYFAPFEDPSKKMRAYIKKPLGTGETDLKEGYIYAFQLDGCAYTKIGKSAVRKDKTPEASLASRMKDHERSRGPDLQIVLERRVPFVGRVENLVKIHLAAGRMREKCSCKNSMGEALNHGNHIEWFNNSLDEIWTVVEAWEQWILSDPYVKRDTNIHHLSPEWMRHLEDIGGSQTGRDVWLDWLHQHVPKLPKMPIKDAVESSESTVNKTAAEIRGSFVRSNAAGFKLEINRVRTNFL